MRINESNRLQRPESQHLTASARPYFDIALVFADVVQANLDPAWGEGYIRNTILPQLLCIDQQIITSRSKLGTLEVVGTVKLDGMQEFRGLMSHLDYWKNELSMILRIPRTDRPGKNGGLDIVVT